jgi:hypothetical protein
MDLKRDHDGRLVADIVAEWTVSRAVACSVIRCLSDPPTPLNCPPGVP